MTYVANSIVTVDGKEYRPGDTIQMPADSKALGILVGIGYVIWRPCIDDAQQPAVQADAASEAVTGNFSRSELETMTKANLQKLAADLGIDAAAELSKAKLIDAIASVEVGVPIQESE
jgi:hypothetical protein